MALKYDIEKVKAMLTKRGIEFEPSKTYDGVTYTDENGIRYALHANYFEDAPEVGFFSAHIVTHSVEDLEHILFGGSNEG